MCTLRSVYTGKPGRSSSLVALCGLLPREGRSRVHVEPIVSGEGKTSGNGNSQEARWTSAQRDAAQQQLKGLAGSEWAPSILSAGGEASGRMGA